MMTSILILAVGLVLLTAGAESLVRGASNIATRLGIPSLIVGLTIVTFGTSAPEMAVSVAAAWSDQADIALGNVVGSNVFNLLAVLGLASLVSPSGIVVAEPALRFDLPVMVAVAIACLPIFVTGREIARSPTSACFATVAIKLYASRGERKAELLERVTFHDPEPTAMPSKGTGGFHSTRASKRDLR